MSSGSAPSTEQDAAGGSLPAPSGAAAGEQAADPPIGGLLGLPTAKKPQRQRSASYGDMVPVLQAKRNEMTPGGKMAAASWLHRGPSPSPLKAAQKHPAVPGISETECDVGISSDPATLGPGDATVATIETAPAAAAAAMPESGVLTVEQIMAMAGMGKGGPSAPRRMRVSSDWVTAGNAPSKATLSPPGAKPGASPLSSLLSMKRPQMTRTETTYSAISEDSEGGADMDLDLVPSLTDFVDSEAGEVEDALCRTHYLSIDVVGSQMPQIEKRVVRTEKQRGLFMQCKTQCMVFFDGGTHKTSSMSNPYGFPAATITLLDGSRAPIYTPVKIVIGVDDSQGPAALSPQGVNEVSAVRKLSDAGSSIVVKMIKMNTLSSATSIHETARSRALVTISVRLFAPSCQCKAPREGRESGGSTARFHVISRSEVSKHSEDLGFSVDEEDQFNAPRPTVGSRSGATSPTSSHSSRPQTHHGHRGQAGHAHHKHAHSHPSGGQSQHTARGQSHPSHQRQASEGGTSEHSKVPSATSSRSGSPTGTSPPLKPSGPRKGSVAHGMSPPKVSTIMDRLGSLGLSDFSELKAETFAASAAAEPPSASESAAAPVVTHGRRVGTPRAGQRT